MSFQRSSAGAVEPTHQQGGTNGYGVVYHPAVDGGVATFTTTPHESR